MATPTFPSVEQMVQRTKTQNWADLLATGEPDIIQRHSEFCRKLDELD